MLENISTGQWAGMSVISSKLANWLVPGDNEKNVRKKLFTFDVCIWCFNYTEPTHSIDQYSSPLLEYPHNPETRVRNCVDIISRTCSHFN